MRIIIAGGTGFLGAALLAALRRDDHDVSVLTRQPRAAHHIAWSATGTRAWMSALAGAGAVINLAGEPIAAKRWTQHRKHAIRNSRVDATRLLVEAIAQARPAPGVFLSGSGIGVYGLRGDEPLTEDAPIGWDFLASVCRDWESEALKTPAPTRVVLLRTGVVLAADDGALPQLARPFRFFAGGPMGSGRQYLSWIHLDDWVQLVRWSLTTAVSGPLNLTAPQPVTNKGFAEALGRALRRPAIVPAPALALRLALGEMADGMLLGGQRVLPARASAGGFAFEFPGLDAALADIYGRM